MDRLATPLPGLRGFARFAREGAFRPGPDGLRGIPDLPYERAPLPGLAAGTASVRGPGGGRPGLPGRRGPPDGPPALGTFALSAEPVLEPLPPRPCGLVPRRPSRDDLWDLSIGASRVLR